MCTLHLKKNELKVVTPRKRNYAKDYPRKLIIVVYEGGDTLDMYIHVTRSSRDIYVRNLLNIHVLFICVLRYP